MVGGGFGFVPEKSVFVGWVERSDTQQFASFCWVSLRSTQPTWRISNNGFAEYTSAAHLNNVHW